MKNLLKRLMALIVTTAMMFSLVTVITSNQPATANPAAIIAGQVASAVAKEVIGQAIKSLGGNDTLYIVELRNDTQDPLLFQGSLDIKKYWPLRSEDVKPGNTAYGIFANSQFQTLGVYRTSPSDYVTGVYRNAPTIGKSEKKALIDIRNQGSLPNPSEYGLKTKLGTGWVDVRVQSNISQQNSRIRVAGRHIKGKNLYPDVDRDVTLWEFTFKPV